MIPGAQCYRKYEKDCYVDTLTKNLFYPEISLHRDHTQPLLSTPTTTGHLQPSPMKHPTGENACLLLCCWCDGVKNKQTNIQGFCCYVSCVMVWRTSRQIFRGNPQWCNLIIGEDLVSFCCYVSCVMVWRTSRQIFRAFVIMFLVWWCEEQANIQGFCCYVSCVVVWRTSRQIFRGNPQWCNLIIWEDLVSFCCYVACVMVWRTSRQIFMGNPQGCNLILEKTRTAFVVMFASVMGVKNRQINIQGEIPRDAIWYWKKLRF